MKHLKFIDQSLRTLHFHVAYQTCRQEISRIAKVMVNLPQMTEAHQDVLTVALFRESLSIWRSDSELLQVKTPF